MSPIYACSFYVSVAFFASLALSACDPMQDDYEPAVTDAIAVIYPTEGFTASGFVTLRQEKDQLRIMATIHGLAPGEHAFHIHDKGNCSGKDGKTAGGHFNPYGTSHGGPTDPDHHVGDLGNITADASGTASVDIIDALATLNSGAANVLGRAFVLHEGPDDYSTQPSGAAGSRVGCGVIGHR